MATDLDQLQIELVGKTVSADKAIDKMCLKLTNLQTALSKLDTNGSVGKLDTLTKSMQNMSNIRFSSVNGLAKSVNELGKIKMSGIINSAVAMRTFGTSVRMLNRIKLTETIPQMSALGNSIVKLAKSASALDKDGVKRLAWGMDKLTRSVSHMMVQFSKLPKIDESVVRMAEAVSKFARTGKSGANAADRLGNAFSRMGNVLSRVSSKIIHFPRMLPRIHSGGISAAKGIDAFRNSLFRLVGLVGGVYGLLRGIKACVDYASHLREVQNVVDVSFGQYSDKIEKFSKNSIRNYGISELAAKQTAGRFQAMGMAAGITRKKMAEMSVEMTKLSADFASFYDRDQSKVATSMESILTGTTKPLRQYGIDLTQATLQEWAMKHGMEANMKSMSQAEKIMLRYNYVLANSKAAQGDFIRTAGTWANQIRILKEQLRQLAGIMGQAFINALKPMLQALNKALLAVTDFVTKVVNALGKIFGWKMETSKNIGIDTELEDAADAAGDLADNTGKAVKNAKALNQQLQKTDELNVLHSNKDLNGGGSGSGGSSPSGSGGGANDDAFKMVDTESAFKSKINDLHGLGNYIRDTLINELGGIDWNSVYEKAASFGTGLASFMNGLFEPKNGKYLFGTLGTAIVNCINTGFEFTKAFSDTFNWTEFGNGINQGISNFMRDFDLELASDSLLSLTNGIIDAFTASVPKKKDFKKFGTKLNKAVNNYMKGLKLVKAAEAVANLANGIIGFFLKAIPSKKQWESYGNKLGESINAFFKTFDFKATGRAINKFADGLLKFLISAVKKVDWDKVGKSIGDFFSGLKAEQIVIDFLHLAAALTKAVVKAIKGWAKSSPQTLLLSIGAVVLWHKKKKMTSYILGSMIGDEAKSILGGNEISIGSVIAKATISKISPIVAKGVEIGKVAIGKVLDLGKVGAKVVIDKVTTAFEKATVLASTLKDGVTAFLKKTFTMAGYTVSVGTAGALTITAAAGIALAYEVKQGDEERGYVENTSLAGGGQGQGVLESVTNLEKNLKSTKNTDNLAKNIKTIATYGNKISDLTFDNFGLKGSANLAKVSTKASTLGKNLKGIKAPKTSGYKSARIAINTEIDKIIKKINKIPSNKKITMTAKLGNIKQWNIMYKTLKYMDTMGLTPNQVATRRNGGVWNPKTGQKFFASGGFPNSADMFMANENGVPELIGTMGRRTAVASGTEITGIRDAINYSADQEAALLNAAVKYLGIIANKNVTISGKDIGQSARNYAKDYYNRTGNNAFVF